MIDPHPGSRDKASIWSNLHERVTANPIFTWVSNTIFVLMGCIGLLLYGAWSIVEGLPNKVLDVVFKYDFANSIYSNWCARGADLSRGVYCDFVPIFSVTMLVICSVVSVVALLIVPHRLLRAELLGKRFFAAGVFGLIVWWCLSEYIFEVYDKRGKLAIYFIVLSIIISSFCHGVVLLAGCFVYRKSIKAGWGQASKSTPAIMPHQSDGTRP